MSAMARKICLIRKSPKFWKRITPASPFGGDRLRLADAPGTFAAFPLALSLTDNNYAETISGELEPMPV
jgi:hypothetical protein